MRATGCRTTWGRRPGVTAGVATALALVVSACSPSEPDSADGGGGEDQEPEQSGAASVVQVASAPTEGDTRLGARLMRLPAGAEEPEELPDGISDRSVVEAHWSPDGTRVAFTELVDAEGLPAPCTEDRPAVTSRLRVMDPDGSDLVEVDLTVGFDGWAWLPDGERLVVNTEKLGEVNDTCVSEENRVFVVSAADGSATELSPDRAPQDARLSTQPRYQSGQPCGDQVLFTTVYLPEGADGDTSVFYLADPAGGAPETLIGLDGWTEELGGDPGQRAGIRPACSADGSVVAFLLSDSGGTLDPADGRSGVGAVRTRNGSVVVVEERPESEGDHHDAVPSPDGAWVAFEVKPEDGDLSVEGRVAAVEGGEVVSVGVYEQGFQFNPVWHPDGDRFLLTGPGEVVDASSGEVSSEEMPGTLAAAEAYRAEWDLRGVTRYNEDTGQVFLVP